jgi:proprotein convertase subtilisin/kexin type 5
MIDNGTMPYNISCRESAILSKSCRRCSNTSCYDCYVVNGFYLNGTTCVTSCGDATKFMSYANVTNGTCQTCINNCATCTSSTVCVTCLNTSSYYLYTNDFTCKLMCLNNSGFVTSTLDSRPICSPCFDYPYCLECSSTASGACSKCSNNSFLLQGSCLTNCSSPMLYNSNGLCLPCNTSCATCSGPGNTACILCAIGYVNSSGKCQPSCDSGKSIIPSTN